MISDAIIKMRTVGKGIERIEVYAPKFHLGSPVMILNDKYRDKPVKLITGWEDLPGVKNISINGAPTPIEQIGKCALGRGMVITTDNENVVYVVVPDFVL